MGRAMLKPFRRVNPDWTKGGGMKDDHKDRTE